MKRYEYDDAIYCIDEPEAHLSTALHGPLLEAMLELVPQQSQLWIATHSVGFVRKAFDMERQSRDVVFLDFSEKDFDQAVEITPRIPDRSFWQTTYQVALDDLAGLIAPDNIVLCEGDKNKADEGFDAECYNRVFSDDHPDTLFISRGAASEVENSDDLIAVLRAVAKGSAVWRLIDRDDMSDGEREKQIFKGIRVLSRRELENYLYDPGVLRTFLRMIEKEEFAEDIIREHKELLLLDQTMSDVDITREKAQKLFESIRDLPGLNRLGKRRKEFALHHLAPALKQTPGVYSELCADIFPHQ